MDDDDGDGLRRSAGARADRDDAVVLELGARLVPRLLIAGVLAVALGVALLVALLGGTAQTTPEGDDAAVAIGLVISALVVLFGVFCLWAARRGLGARLVIDAAGLRREPVRRGGWALGWHDLDRVGTSLVRWAPPRAVATFGRGERMGRIVLVAREPADPGTRVALRRLPAGDEPEPWTHRVTLGTDADWHAAADGGLRRFAGDRYVPPQERDVLRRRYS